MPTPNLTENIPDLPLVFVPNYMVWHPTVILVVISWTFVSPQMWCCDPEDEGTVILRNVRNYSLNNTVSHPRRLHSSAPLLSLHLPYCVTVHLPIFKSVTAITNLHITYCSDNKLRHVRLLQTVLQTATPYHDPSTYCGCYAETHHTRETINPHWLNHTSNMFSYRVTTDWCFEGLWKSYSCSKYLLPVYYLKLSYFHCIWPALNLWFTKAERKLWNAHK